MPKLQIYRRKDMVLVIEHELVEKDGNYVAEMIVPNFPMEDVIILFDGQPMRVKPFVRPKQKSVVPEDQIINMYWNYGENHRELGKSDDEDDGNVCMSKYYDDLNLHVETAPGNDGKIAKVIIKYYQKCFELHGVVSNNEAVFEKVLVNCALHK